MKKNIYGIIAIVLFLVLSIGAGWYFLAWKSTAPEQQIEIARNQPSNTWEIYRNEKFGYEIKYPKGMEIGGKPEDESMRIDIEKYLGVPDNLINERDKALDRSFILSMSVWVEPANNTSQLSLKDWIWENVHEQKQAPYPELEKDIIFAGEPAYYAEYDRGVTLESEVGLYKHVLYSIFILRNNNLYRINAIKLPPNPSEKWKNHPYYSYFEQYIPISEAIINSFKFTDAD